MCRAVLPPVLSCRDFPQVGDNESFYTTFLGGTVGILYLDALELSPQWHYGGGNRIGSGTTSKEGTGSKAASSLSTPDLGATAEAGARDTGEERKSSSTEKPLIGDSQWQRLRKTLEEQVRVRFRTCPVMTLWDEPTVLCCGKSVMPAQNLLQHGWFNVTARSTSALLRVDIFKSPFCIGTGSFPWGVPLGNRGLSLPDVGQYS